MNYFRSLQGQIALAFVLLLLLLQGGGLVLFATAGVRTVRAQVQDSVVTADGVAKRIISARGKQLADSAAVLASDFGFRAALATGDQETIVSALENSAQRIHADMALSLDLYGKPRVAYPAMSADALAAIGSVMQVQGGRQGSIDILDTQTGLYQIVIVPVRAPAQIGSVMLGFALDRSVAADIRATANADVTLLEADPSGRLTAHGSTLNPADLAAALPLLKGTLASGATADEMASADGTARRMDSPDLTLPGGRVLSSVVGLGYAHGNGHLIYLLINRSLDAALAPYWTLGKELLGLSFLLLLGAVALSWRVARDIAQPLKVLTRSAVAIAAGSRNEKLQSLERAGEIGSLARAFGEMQRDIFTREKHIEDLAYVDQLSRLPNRLAFSEHVAEAIRNAPPGQQYAVILLDLDRFKLINELLNHVTGDRVLKSVGKRLTELDTVGITKVARLGGDEFALFLPVESEVAALNVAKRVANQLRLPIPVDEQQEVDVPASMGVALYPEHGATPEDLLRRADVAMYEAKSNRRGIILYDESLSRASSSYLTMMSELRHAVEADELVMFYQPKVDLKGEELAVEALVRWKHPGRGLVPPNEFIPFAEKAGFIQVITRWALRKSLQNCCAWRSRGLAIQVAVNISALDLLDSEFPRTVERLLKETGCAAQWVVLEVTESIVAASDVAQESMKALRALGCDLSIDDFGTGMSNFEYLMKAPVDEIKIDRSLIIRMCHHKQNALVVERMINLIHILGMRVTAEGVENMEELRMLKDFGCDTAQGFLMSRPVPAEALERWFTDKLYLGFVPQSLGSVLAAAPLAETDTDLPLPADAQPSGAASWPDARPSELSPQRALDEMSALASGTQQLVG